MLPNIEQKLQKLEDKKWFNRRNVKILENFYLILKVRKINRQEIYRKII